MRNNVRDAVLPPFCFDPDGFPPHRHSTIAINAYPSAGQIVEIGWRKESTTGEPIYSGFWKYVVGGSEWDNGIFTTICCGWRRFKEFKVPAVDAWQFRYDNNNDGIFETYIDQVQTLSFSNGMASGETGRRGGSGTNAYDHFADLKYTIGTGDSGWTNWQTNMWWKNCIPNWGWDWLSNSSYQILNGIPCH